MICILQKYFVNIKQNCQNPFAQFAKHFINRENTKMHLLTNDLI